MPEQSEKELSPSARISPLPTLLAFLRWFVPAFTALSVLLVFRHGSGGDDMCFSVRSGILRDLLAELPIGRQALVGSLRFMPLPTLAALPFVPFLKPGAYGYAYDYGLALVLAGALLPLGALLRSIHVLSPRMAAAGMIALAAAIWGNSCHGDLLFCLAFAVMARHFESRDKPVTRALAGVFYGLALFSHFAGIVLAFFRLLLMVVRQASCRSNPERNAVNWINGATMAYVLAVYLFFNWMIMLDPVYAFRNTPATIGAGLEQAELEKLAAQIKRDFPEQIPVVSGHWGYCLGELLRETGGYHFMDFHHDKLPEWEHRRLLLIVPGEGNPFRAWSDLPIEPGCDDERLRGCLLLAKKEKWLFYLTWGQHGQIIEN
jgi:hypothetical protein